MALGELDSAGPHVPAADAATAEMRPAVSGDVATIDASLLEELPSWQDTTNGDGATLGGVESSLQLRCNASGAPSERALAR